MKKISQSIITSIVKEVGIQKPNSQQVTRNNKIICNKAVQLNILPIPQLHFEYKSNDRNKFEREGIKVPKTNNIRNNQKDSQQEMNNLNSGKTDLIEKQLNDSEI